MSLSIENYIDAEKDNAWIRDFISTWKLDRSTGGNDLALQLRLHEIILQSPDSGLALLVALAMQAADHAEIIAVGEHLEWYIEKHGAGYWSTLNELCRRVQQFRIVMASVWGASLSKDLRRKVEMWR